MITTRAEAAHYLKDAGGLKLVVIGADGHEVAAMFAPLSSAPRNRTPNNLHISYVDNVHDVIML
jgi:hypothetical protein